MPKTLRPKLSVALADLAPVSAPRLPYAYAVVVQPARQWLMVYDMRNGTQGKAYNHGAFGPRGLNFENAVVSPDGRFLFTAALTRFRLSEGEVKLEESISGLTNGAGRETCVSADGALVCVPTGGGNPTPPGRPKALYCTNIYSTDSFMKPPVVVHSGNYPTAVGFDMRAGLIYTQGGGKDLIIFDMQGNRLKDFMLGGGPRQFLVHPDGRKFLVLTDKVLSVELPER